MFGKEVGLSSNLVDNSIIILTGLAQRRIEAVDNRAKQHQKGAGGYTHFSCEKWV